MALAVWSGAASHDSSLQPCGFRVGALGCKQTLDRYVRHAFPTPDVTRPRPTGTRPDDCTNAHLDVDQRVSIGKAARRAVPRSSHAAWTPTAARPDPVALLRSQEESRVAEPHRAAPSADVGVAVRVLPRGRDHHGLGSRHHTGCRPVGPVLWRRASRQLRWVRGTRSHAGVRHQRLRRDEPGSVRVGREAPGHELRDRGPVAGLLDRRRLGSLVDALRALVPGSHGRVRRRHQPRCLVRAPRRRRAHRTLGATGQSPRDPSASSRW